MTADASLLTVVDRDAVRHALSDAEPMTTALQPLTTVRTWIAQQTALFFVTCLYWYQPNAEIVSMYAVVYVATVTSCAHAFTLLTVGYRCHIYKQIVHLS